jgi:hypothetical protein
MVGIEIGPLVTGLSQGRSNDAGNVHLAVQARIGHDENELTGGGCLGADASVCIDHEVSIDKRVGYSITQLVWMPPQDRRRSKAPTLIH